MARFVDIASGYPVDLPRQRMTLGSAPDNTVPITEGFGVSAHHFQVVPVPGGMLLADLTGQQATLVNDQPVSQVILTNGDIVSAGKLKLRYESQATPPPLPPENPPLAVPEPANALFAAPSVGALVPRAECGGETGRKSVRKTHEYKDGGRTVLPNAATAVHLYKWLLPVLGLIFWLGKWAFGFYRVKADMDDGETMGAAYALVDTYRVARDAKAPQIQNIRDPERLVRLLVRGVYGSGEAASHEIKAVLNEDQAEDALEMLTWKEGDGLTFKEEFRELLPTEDGTAIIYPGGSPEALAPDEVE